MEFISTLLTGLPFLAPPTWAGWAVWLALLGLLIVGMLRARQVQPEWKGREWGLFIGLLILVPLTNLFIGIRLNPESARPFPDLPANAPGSALMPFSAIPWTLGGGLLGPLGAVLLGGFAGLLRGTWDTYTLFSTLELALLGAFFSVLARQRFRTTAYRILRQPLIAALLLIPFHALFSIISALFTQWGIAVSTPVTARLDFALSNASVVTLAFGVEMLIAGLVGQVLAMAYPAAWGGKQALLPSPGERSLEMRFLFTTGTFAILLLLTLLIGDWIVAGRAAREMLADRLSGTGEVAAQSVPFFLESGQNLAVQLASDPRLLEASGPELSSLLGQRMQAVPYFDQFLVVDVNDQSLLAVYPDLDREEFRLNPDEASGVSLAADGVLTQIYTIPPNAADDLARVSFLVAIVDGAGGIRRALIGRTTLKTNPLISPLINSIDSMSELGGAGFLMDESGQILYHSASSQPRAFFNETFGNEPLFYDGTAPDGTRELVYYQPVTGRPWAVVLTVPARLAQQLALSIALPLSVMILFLAFLALILLRLGLRVITGSLQNLASEANLIAQGKLDHPLQVAGVDEVGQLRRAFEQMRVSLQARLEESNRLLRVSQGVASSLEMQDAVKPVLEAILSMGANSVRVVLAPAILPETPVELPSHFALGPAGDGYAPLDDQLLTLARRQEQIVLPNLTRSRELKLDSSLSQPLALLAVALRYENRYYGVVWAGFEQPRLFSESDVRFMTTLAGQAALAVSNARLFLNVEASRRQLEAILNSTPDPVLVTDQHNRLLLANRAAAQALGMTSGKSSGQSTEKVIKLKPLLALLQNTSGENQSAEIVLPDQRTYLGTASSVIVEGRNVGRVCILRDVTYFKELDTMKSEFVATVSHDLRSPLTLMRGYATMLETTGELNEQQQEYVKKIITGVENMSRLVNNLLDLGRIEFGVGLQVGRVTVLNVLERVNGELQVQARQKNIALNVELPKDMPHALQADEALLVQAVYNLVENAIKYTPQGGRVTLRARDEPGYLVFEVQDSGIGIPPGDVQHLFERFYRSKQRAARAQPGTGLGLAIVHSIAESHGGNVWVESDVGKGSTFHLRIPLAQPKATKAA